MCILRRNILEKVGGWDETALTEDSELAVRMHAQGYIGYVFADTVGRGLIPTTFSDMKKQQVRWTAGPVQQ
ncbi:glycosyltransferase family 2 protein, partial [Pectobacterium parmentieri]